MATALCRADAIWFSLLVEFFQSPPMLRSNKRTQPDFTESNTRLASEFADCSIASSLEAAQAVTVSFSPYYIFRGLS